MNKRQRTFDEICNEIFDLYKKKVVKPAAEKEEASTTTAPAPAPTKPSKPAPAPSQPERPNRDPFKTPRPLVQPAPQNKKKVHELNHLHEGYEDIHPDTRKAFEDPENSRVFGQSPMKSHPYLKGHGRDALARGEEYSSNLVSRRPGNPAEAFFKIQRIESIHKEELNALAIKLVAQVFNIPEHYMKVIEGLQLNDTSIKLRQSLDITNLPEEVIKHIHMRGTMNMLAHGAGVHLMGTLYHMASEELDDIDPRLKGLYDILSAGAPHQYWGTNIAAMVQNLTHAAVGSVIANIDGDEEPGGEKHAKIEASGVCFVIVLQELAKGVIQLLSHHHIGRIEDEQQLRTILAHADRIDFEPFFIMLGPSLYRKFLEVSKQIPGASIAQTIHAVAVHTPDEVHQFLIDMEKNTPKAKQTLTDWYNAIYTDSDDDAQLPKTDDDEGEDWGLDLDSWKESHNNMLHYLNMLYESKIAKRTDNK